MSAAAPIVYMVSVMAEIAETVGPAVQAMEGCALCSMLGAALY
jgi:hypothetical protein